MNRKALDELKQRIPLLDYVQAHGWQQARPIGFGRFLARGLPAHVYEGGLEQRIVLIVFDSVAQAIAAHDSPGYQQALRALGNAADRDLRIVEGVE